MNENTNQDYNKNWWWLSAFIITMLFIYYLSSVLMPFLIAFVLAYLTDPIVHRLTLVKIPRTLAVSIVFVLLFSIIFALLLLLIPLLERQLVLLASKIPQMFVWVQHTVVPWMEKHFGMKEVLNFNAVRSFLTSNLSQAGSIASTVWKTVFLSGYTIFMLLFNLVMIPVVTFYLLRDWNKITSGSQALFPRAQAALITRLVRQCDEVLSAFFRGQLLVMLALGLYYVLALWLVGIELALLIGFIISLISIVPYLGFIVGLVLAIIATLFQYHDGIHLVYVFIIFGIGSVLENVILAPLLVGDRIGLHPVAVIFAILAGGQLFGFVGILVALPAAAMIMVLIRYGRECYLTSTIYDVQ